MKDYRDLKAWKKAVRLAVGIYKLIKYLPAEEKYAIADQMKRAAVSVASNIAEGHKRYNIKEFKYFLKISMGSLAELETQLTICLEADMLSENIVNQALKACNELDKMIYSLIKSLPNTIQQLDK